MTRLTAFAKYYGIGLVLGGFVAARHCYDVLEDSSKEISAQLHRIEKFGIPDVTRS
jgi:hypothetical protein